MKLPDNIERELRAIEAELAAAPGQKAGTPRLRGLRAAIEATVHDFNTRMSKALIASEQRLDEIAALKERLSPLQGVTVDRADGGWTGTCPTCGTHIDRDDPLEAHAREGRF